MKKENSTSLANSGARKKQIRQDKWVMGPTFNHTHIWSYYMFEIFLTLMFWWHSIPKITREYRSGLWVQYNFILLIC
jgi:hypothetical protein